MYTQFQKVKAKNIYHFNFKHCSKQKSRNRLDYIISETLTKNLSLSTENKSNTTVLKMRASKKYFTKTLSFHLNKGSLAVLLQGQIVHKKAENQSKQIWLWRWWWDGVGCMKKKQIKKTDTFVNTSSKTNTKWLSEIYANRLKRNQTTEYNVSTCLVLYTAQAIPTNQTQWENSCMEDECQPDLVCVIEGYNCVKVTISGMIQWKLTNLDALLLNEQLLIREFSR